MTDLLHLPRAHALSGIRRRRKYRDDWSARPLGSGGSAGRGGPHFGRRGTGLLLDCALASLPVGHGAPLYVIYYLKQQ